MYFKIGYSIKLQNDPYELRRGALISKYPDPVYLFNTLCENYFFILYTGCTKIQTPVKHSLQIHF